MRRIHFLVRMDRELWEPRASPGGCCLRRSPTSQYLAQGPHGAGTLMPQGSL